MRAAVLRAFGDPDVLQIEEIDTPAPGPGDVLVRVRAVSVNRTLDLAVRAGRFGKPALPHVLGVDPAGEVVKAGEGVAAFLPGARVVATGVRCGACASCDAGAPGDCAQGSMIGVQRWGGAAEYIVLPERAVQPIPHGVDFADAVYIARHAALAVHILRGKADVLPGERVLITGAAGALGGALVQVAAALGAFAVAAAGSSTRAQAAAALGAQAAFAYREQAWSVAREAAGGDFDVVVDTTGDSAVWSAACGLLAHRGRLVSMAASRPDATGRINLRQFYTKRLKLMGAAAANPEDLALAFDLAQRGALKAVIAARLPLSRIADAHRMLENGDVTGKIIIEP